MTIRKITPQEYPQAYHVQLVAFKGIQADDIPECPPEKLACYRASFDEENNLTACMELLPYNVRLGKEIVPMGGIGGVASLPQSRKLGNVRAIFQSIMREMYDDGTVLSILYPFSVAYYRKFGYDICETVRRYKIPLGSLPRDKAGSFSQYMPGEDMADIKRIYQAYSAKYQQTVVRTDDNYKRRGFQHDPYKTRAFTYLWHDENGVARAYALIHGSQNGSEWDIHIWDMAYESYDALRGILSLLNGLAAQYKHLVWNAPMEVELQTLLPEPECIENTVAMRSMSRIVNVQKALECLACDYDGSAAIKVIDQSIGENDGVFCITAKGQSVTVTRDDSLQPDAELSIAALTQITTGYMSYDQALAMRRDVREYAQNALLPKLFVQKPVALFDGF